MSEARADTTMEDTWRPPDAPTYVDAGMPPLVVGLSRIRGPIDRLARVANRHALDSPTLGWDDVERTTESNALTLAGAMTREALETYVRTHDFTTADENVTRFTRLGMEVVVARDQAGIRPSHAA